MSTRQTEKPVERTFLDRWSPRAFDGSEIPFDHLEVMLEAARWAPSAFNYQPWHFLYAQRGDGHWDKFLSLLLPFNVSWACRAAALVYVLSDRFMMQGGDRVASHSHSFDAGAAWAQLGLQASLLGYHAHGMTGVDFDRARHELGVPDEFRIEAAVAIGRRGDPSLLPEKLQQREHPSDRKDLREVVTHGPYSGAS